MTRGILALAITLGIGLAACAEPADEVGSAADPTEDATVDAATDPAATGTTEVIVATAGDIAFQAGPPSLPAGAEFAVIEGDPAKAGPLTLRLRFPANYDIPPHWHHVLEHVTVLTGTLHVGMGDTMDKSQPTALGPGDFGVIPIEMTHFAWTGDQPVTFQLHSTGPWGITYVNPEDDPRNAEGAAGS